jgi:hypothetical protein
MKTTAIDKLLEYQSKKLFGRSRMSSIASLICVCCGGDASVFKDELSKREFTISGMCQVCQDKTF